MFKRFERFDRFGQMEGLKIFGLGIIQQIVGVENFQPLQFDITPFTSEGKALGMGALASLLLCKPCAKQKSLCPKKTSPLGDIRG